MIASNRQTGTIVAARWSCASTWLARQAYKVTTGLHMERGFLSQKGSGVRRGVKEKQVSTGVKLVDRTKSNMDAGTGLFTKSDANLLKEVVSPSVIDEHVAMEEANSTRNAPGKPLYATATSKPNGKKVYVRTLFTPGGNGIDVVVLVDSICAINARFANTAYGFFLGKKVAYPVVANYVRNTWGKYGLVRSMFSSSNGLFSFQFSSMHGLDAMLENGPWFIQNNPLILKKWHLDENLLKDVSTISVWVKLHGVPVTAFSEDGLSAIATKLGTPLMLDSYTSDMCMQSWGRSSYARVMIELRADVELKDNIVVAMPKITREGHYTCNVRVEYEWKPPRCSSCKVFGHIHEECPKNTGAGEKKTVKKPSQTSRGVPVGPKMGFKPQKEYRPVPKKPNASSSGNKKKGVEPTIEVSNSNPFDVLNSVDNDVEFGKLRLLDNNENPLVPTGIVESDSEVEVVFDETANLRISTSCKDGSAKGYGTNSLLEQWRDSYPDNDDYDEVKKQRIHSPPRSCNNIPVCVRPLRKLMRQGLATSQVAVDATIPGILCTIRAKIDVAWAGNITITNFILNGCPEMSDGCGNVGIRRMKKINVKADVKVWDMDMRWLSASDRLILLDLRAYYPIKAMAFCYN
ncbi:RNA-directed DNA polymerase, eukaryota, reverse transcriptase zinc-binding domain protein, partial [Tanacetum coccineum]